MAMKHANVTRDYHRGEIYYADMNPAFGHEQGGIRPVLVIQNNASNRLSPTLIVAKATRRTNKKPSMAAHVVLENVIGKDSSLFLLEQIRTIDKRRIRRFVRKLTSKQIAEIDTALCASLHLFKGDFHPGGSAKPRSEAIRNA